MSPDTDRPELSPEQRRRVDQLLSEVIDRPVDERQAFLSGQCSDDADVLQEALSLLGAYEKDTASFLEHPPAMPNETLPECIGPYRILKTLGEGGMGVVYLAEQTEPIKRRVALKVIKLGMDTKQVIARFEAERQALAMMDHASIARVFDAGATDDGRPFFVMEAVAGVSVTEHCDRQKLDVAERIDLFMQVCEAVQHAHQKGIIHRDLKPSNILVASRDGQAIPKVIDFGIARATSQKLTERTLFTEQGQLIGTPEYMSPEQAEMSGQDIDTRCDIYSLGVLLYELLSGSRPFEAQTLRRAGLAEIHRIIRELEPPTPSMRLRSLASSVEEPLSATRIVKARRTDLRALTGVLRSDLDWVVMKCLDKNRERRYETANALAMELRRFLNNEPVLAGPPSLSYRFGKFARRNRGAMIAGGTIAAVLVVSTVVSVAFAFAAELEHAKSELALLDRDTALDAEREQRERAQQREREADIARAEEARRAEELEQVAAFQESQLSVIDVPLMATRLRADLLAEARNAWETAKADASEIEERTARLEALVAGTNFTNLASHALGENVFERALVAVDQKFTDQPLVRARLLQAVANSLGGLGLYERATRPQTDAVAIRRRILGNEHPDTLTSINHMGALLKGQGKLDEAESYYLDALKTRRRVLGNEHPDTLTSIGHVGALLEGQGKLDEAEPYHLEALEGRRRVLGDEHPDTLTSIKSMGALLRFQGKFDEAVPYLQEALDGRRRVFGDAHPDTLNSISHMGVLLQSQGKYDEAEPYFQEALEGSRRVRGDKHPVTLTSINNMGALLRHQGRLDDAAPYYQEALDGYRRVLGDLHPHTLIAIEGMGRLLRSRGKFEEAEPYYREALEGRRRVLGDEHPQTLTTICYMGYVLQSQGRLVEAEPYYQEALEGSRRTLGHEHPVTLAAISYMGVLLRSQGRLNEAEPYYLEALDGNRRARGDEHPGTLATIGNMGTLLQDQGRLDEAEPYYLEALETQRRVLGDNHPHTLISIRHMGGLLSAQGRYAESEPILREFVESGTSVLGADHWNVAEARSLLGESVAGQERYDEAEPLLLGGYTGLESSLPGGRRAQELPPAIERLIKLYDAWGKPNNAGEWRAKLAEFEAASNE